jgi:hypothetical protein
MWHRVSKDFAHKGGVRALHQLEVLEFLVELWGLWLTLGLHVSSLLTHMMLRVNFTIAVFNLIL